MSASDPWDIDATDEQDEPLPATGPSGTAEATVSICTQDLASTTAALPFARGSGAARVEQDRGTAAERAPADAGGTVSLLPGEVDALASRSATPFVSPTEAGARVPAAPLGATLEHTIALEPVELAGSSTRRPAQADGAPFDLAAPGAPVQPSMISGAPWARERGARVDAPAPGQSATVDLPPAEVEAYANRLLASRSLTGGAAAPAAAASGELPRPETAPAPLTPSSVGQGRFSPASSAIEERPKGRADGLPVALTSGREESAPAPARPKPPTPTARIYGSFARVIKRT